LTLRTTALFAGLTLWAGGAAAQTMRPFTTFRQMHGETRLTARLEYAAGNFRLGTGRPNELYRMDLSYDQDRFLPMSDFNISSATAVLGLKASGMGGVRVVSRNQLQQTAAVTISPRVDVALDLTLGATDADVELGGLRLTDLDLKTGASRAVIRFSQPNGVRCRHAGISAGAAEISFIGLANSRCDNIDFEGGMGKVTLDFGGSWSSSTRASVKMAMGELTLRLPRKAGVRLTMDRFLSHFDPAGLIRRGNEFVSPGYARAERKLDLDLTTAVGGVNIEWVE
jgi:hypothetical protein